MGIASITSSRTPKQQRHTQPTRKRDRIRSAQDLSPAARAALADMASVLRSVRYDMAKPAPKCGSRFTEEYAIEIGMQVLEVADTHFGTLPRDWDAIINALLNRSI